jgi:hypothetical protein
MGLAPATSTITANVDIAARALAAMSTGVTPYRSTTSTSPAGTAISM